MKTRSGDSCGCAMGAKFMVAGLLAAALSGGWQLYAGRLSSGPFILRLLLATFLAGIAGKIVGIVRYRMTHAIAWKEQ